MPKITLNKTGGGTIRYDQDDFLLGINTTSADSQSSKLVGNTAAIGIDPIRDYGYLSIGQKDTAVSGADIITAYIRQATNNGSTAVLLENGNKLHQMTTIISGTITNNGTFPHTIVHGAHSSLVGNDMITYYVNVSGTQTLYSFYSFTDATDWDVGAYKWSNSTFDDDYMSTVPVSPLASPYLTGGAGFPHPLVVGDDDVLYIGDRNFVHAFDGQTGTFYPAVLTLPVGYIITCFTTTPDINLAIGTYSASAIASDTFNRGTAKVWFWNYLALDPDYSRDLRDNYVSELVLWAGTIAAFTYGRRGLSAKGSYKLQALQGNQFVTVTNWETGQPIRGGVDNVGDDLYWNAAGTIMCYIKRPDNGQYVLMQPATVSGTENGMLKFFTANDIIHASAGAAGANTMVFFNGNYNTFAVWRGLVANPPFGALQQGKLNKITIKFKNDITGAGGIRLNSLLNDNDTVLIDTFTTVGANLRVTQIQNRTDGTPLGTFSSLVPEFVFGLGSGITNAPVVDWLEYEFELTNT